MQIRYMSLDSKLPPLVVAHLGDAGFDLYAREDTTLEPGQWKAVPSGMIFEIPEGYVGLLWDKSGLALNNGLKTLGGVIDSGYRGEVLIGMINLSQQTYIFRRGEKVAQILIQKIETPEFVQVDSLDETTRGADGFGSTGK